MVIEVKKLIASRKYTGTFAYDYLPHDDIVLVPLCKIRDVKVSGEYEIFDDDAVEIKLTVRYILSGQCSYCLNEAEKEIIFPTEVLFVTEKNDDDYYYDGTKLDLKQAVDDALLVSQPNVLLCKDDCKGIDVPE